MQALWSLFSVFGQLSGIKTEPLLHYGMLSFNSGIVLPDPKDLPFYEAICGNRENQIYLVTGNLKHFPKDQYIISAREMLDILRRKFTDH